MLIANDINDMGALTKLDMSKNDIATKKAGKALGEALKGNTVLKELVVCKLIGGRYFNDFDSRGFTEEISKGLSGNGAILKFTFSGNDDSKSVTMETTMAVADFSGKGLGVSGAIMVAAFLPKCT